MHGHPPPNRVSFREVARLAVRATAATTKLTPPYRWFNLINQIIKSYKDLKLL